MFFNFSCVFSMFYLYNLMPVSKLWLFNTVSLLIFLVEVFVYSSFAIFINCIFL
jgi:hypothetical protein